MDIQTRLRQAARHTRLDADKELLTEAADEIDALRADAERYRWLRATTNWASSNGERVDVRNKPELWDSAIDASIAKERA